jgi:hypothetical protein
VDRDEKETSGRYHHTVDAFPVQPNNWDKQPGDIFLFTFKDDEPPKFVLVITPNLTLTIDFTFDPDFTGLRSGTDAWVSRASRSYRSAQTVTVRRPRTS